MTLNLWAHDLQHIPYSTYSTYLNTTSVHTHFPQDWLLVQLLLVLVPVALLPSMLAILILAALLLLLRLLLVLLQK